MKNVTILLQGKILQDSVDFLIKNYPQANVVISTWVGTEVDFSNIPQTYNVVLTKLPTEGGHQNINYQILSTLKGLQFVDTDYVIKLRGDEYYSNLDYVAYEIAMNPHKIHSSPIFFRHWSFMEYHISDHIIAGTTKNLKLMFQSTKFNLENGLVYHTRDGQNFEFWEPEINLTRSYLMAKEPKRWGIVDGRQLMIDNFEIINLENLKPYKVVANVYNKIWYNNYIQKKI